ncbi:hypothetical protein [Streptomyces sp. HC307]|uniref:hypothetical protein n=1 Tax=Streptomyces flavusporus TaxID=3385496 RepID=UPI00391729BF
MRTASGDTRGHHGGTRAGAQHCRVGARRVAARGDVPALEQYTGALPRAVGMMDGGVAALRRDGVAG